MSIRRWWPVLASVVIVAMVGAIELALGRVPMCTCGSIKLWHGVVNSSENSQHLTDWYSFTHVVHGLLFYALLWLAERRLPPGARFVLAVAIEAAWEIVENTPFVINRYRAATISLDYYGDSVVNSLADIVSMMLGYELARRAPFWISAGLIVVLELMLALIIRDNLTLNILMLIYPLDAIKQWQLAGG